MLCPLIRTLNRFLKIIQFYPIPHTQIASSLIPHLPNANHLIFPERHICAAAHRHDSLGNTAQFPPCGLSTAPTAAAPRSPYRHLELCGIAFIIYSLFFLIPHPRPISFHKKFPDIFCLPLLTNAPVGSIIMSTYEQSFI